MKKETTKKATTIYLDEELWRRFRLKYIGIGKSASRIVGELIQADLDIGLVKKEVFHSGPDNGKTPSVVLERAKEKAEKLAVGRQIMNTGFFNPQPKASPKVSPKGKKGGAK